MEFDDSFDNFCIVCDKLIVPPKPAPSPVEAVAVKDIKPKKKPTGCIRVKNADGTTTTRSANGTKTTRPVIKRNTSSSTRLATLAVNNNAAAKLAPLTRSKTTDPTAKSESGAASDDCPTSPSVGPVSPAASEPFHSAIYCSASCAQADAGRASVAYNDIARTLSYEFSHNHPHLDSIITHLPGHHAGLNAFAPPSPLFVSSDTESSSTSTAPGQINHDGPACSAPKMMEYFRMSREGPDSAWHEIQRQRRSSMQPFHHRPVEMTRQNTQGSQYTSFGEVSSDSLSSMWDRDQELNLGRSTSGSGKPRTTPLSPTEERLGLGAGRRSSHSASYFARDRSGSTSIAGSGPAPIPASRPLPRSNLSQASLAASPSTSDLPPEFGSAPSHTLSLLQSYASAFPIRDASSSSQHQRGFVFPGSLSANANGNGNHMALSPNASQSRRSSSNITSTAPFMQRPSTGTIRAKSRSEYPSWDSFGKEACREREREQATRIKRAASYVSSSGGLPMPQVEHEKEHDSTPKQSLKVENGRWKIEYRSPILDSGLSASLSKSRTIRSKSCSSGRSHGGSSTSYSDHDEHEQETANGDDPTSPARLAIPSRPQLCTSSSSARATPKGRVGGMPPPPSIPSRSSATTATSLSRAGSAADLEPVMGQLRVGSRSSTSIHGHVNGQQAGAAGSPVQRGFNWDDYESKGGKMYALPKEYKLNNKAGLFYFK